jgi:hypothetical protein
MRRLLCGLAAGCGSFVVVSAGATALSCEVPEFSYDSGQYTTGDVIIIEGRGWSRGSDEECESSPFGDVRIYMTSVENGQVLVAQGAAEADGRFVVAVRVPAPVSGRVLVEVVAEASAGQEVPGVTSSSPLMVESRIVDGGGMQPVAFGPVDDDPAVWPWILLAMTASGLAGIAVTWRIMGRRRLEADAGHDQVQQPTDRPSFSSAPG